MRRIVTAGVLAIALAGSLAPVAAAAPTGSTGFGYSDCTPSRYAEPYNDRLIVINDRCATTEVVRRTVFIDFHELVVYRTDDGLYYSPVNAYELFPTLLDTARTAVDTLGGENP